MPNVICHFVLQKEMFILEKRYFELSDDSIHRRKIRNLIIQVTMPVFVLLLFFLSPLRDYLNIQLRLIAMIISIVVIQIVIISSPRKKTEETKIWIDNDGIGHFDKFGEEKISFYEVRRIDIIENNEGQIVLMKVFSKDKSMYIHGYRDMDRFFELLKENVSGNIIKVKVNKVNWNSELMFCFYIILSAAMIIVLMNKKIGAIILTGDLLPIITGIILLLVKPLSKYRGDRFKRTEIFWGSFMIIYGVLKYVLYFL